MIVGKKKYPQSREASQFLRDLPAQLVFRKVKLFQLGEVAQFRGNFPHELIVREL